MKVVALMMLVGGWMIAVGGLLAVEATGARMMLTLVGLGTSVAGMMTLNRSHLEHALWKAKGH